MFVILAGGGAMYIERGGGRRKVFEWRAGEFTGLLPFSRLQRNYGEPVMEETSDVLIRDRDDCPALVRECPGITAACVHAMLDRARASRPPTGRTRRRCRPAGSPRVSLTR